MRLTDTRAYKDDGRWTVTFVSDDGDEVRVSVGSDNDITERAALERARAIMVQLTAFGTRGGGRSENAYDAASNGNFDDGEPLLDTRH